MFAAGLGWFRVIFQVREILRPQVISLRIRLPFGVIDEETIHISPIRSNESRVTYN